MANRPTEAVRQRQDINRGCTVTMRMRRGHQETVQRPAHRSFTVEDRHAGPAGHERHWCRPYADFKAKPFGQYLPKVDSEVLTEGFLLNHTDALVGAPLILTWFGIKMSKFGASFDRLAC